MSSSAQPDSCSTTLSNTQHTRLVCGEQENTGHFILHNTCGGITDGRNLFNFFPWSKLKYFASLHTKECEDPSGQIYCVCVLISRWSTMSREQVSISELLLSLDSSELQEAEQVRAAVNQQLSSGESTGLSPPVRLPACLLLYLSICSPDTCLCLCRSPPVYPPPICLCLCLPVLLYLSLFIRLHLSFSLRPPIFLLLFVSFLS